ncbi:Telomerase reverse transcriptase [Ceratocystis pirilliformis]|uniref:Telomerase reverse transcriptase n=1 Tax=Ceratocystis pirilliformis TaxID=259994 RepID=A0ABR3YJN0_9PEZI
MQFPGRMRSNAVCDSSLKSKNSNLKQTRILDHAVLSHYFTRIQTLREYLLVQLPRSSRIRRKKIASLGTKPRANENDSSLEIAAFLDSTLVGIPNTIDASLAITKNADRDCDGVADGGKNPNTSNKYAPTIVDSKLPKMRQQFAELSMIDESYVTISGSQRVDSFCQSEIVDFCVWFIFQRSAGVAFPKHVLCDGYERGSGSRFSNRDLLDRPIPGLSLKRRNEHVEMIKKDPWPQILALLGCAGEDIMIHMLLNCGVFIALKGGVGNLFQISGIPLTSMSMLPLGHKKIKKMAKVSTTSVDEHDHNDKTPLYTPLQIEFLRSRMLYGRAVLTAKGNVKAGFRHIHVLNRYPLTNIANHAEKDIRFAVGDLSTIKIMSYIFPRQFGLHNVFTSKVDFFKTSHKFQDYTMRDDELDLHFGRLIGGTRQLDIKIPKRLRGDAHRLVWRLQVLHNRCSYSELLKHYCPTQFDALSRSPARHSVCQNIASTGPIPTSHTPCAKNVVSTLSLTATARRKIGKRLRRKARKAITLNNGQAITDFATPTYQVSAFCQAVISNIIPNEFWGTGADQQHNKAKVLLMVARFVQLRRFEKMTLHDVVQNLKINKMDWLAPPNLRGKKMSQTDRNKRLEILNEFMYYVFDSVLIPLLRNSFYITESSNDRYQLSYFRHDIWRALSGPVLVDLKKRMFVEMSPPHVQALLSSRPIGFSSLRLLPKVTGMRPIMNLRKRQASKGLKQNLGPSINSLLAPLHEVLKMEKRRRPDLMGCSLAGMEDIFVRLRKFTLGLPTPLPRLYFVKVDVQSAYDTIPQSAVLALMDQIPQESHYAISKHLEVKPGPKTNTGPSSVAESEKPTRRWVSTAFSGKDRRLFIDRIEDAMAATISHRGDDKQGSNGTAPEPALGTKCNTTFYGSFASRVYTTHFLMNKLLAQHINTNVVKIGKKFYAQKQGIPQGSVLSSDLCNLFYADMEARELGFLFEHSAQDMMNRKGDPGQAKDTLLMRLIDDSLLITTDKAKAQRFAEIMLRGLPKYGVTVNPQKSLVNFDCVVNGVRVPRGDEAAFPYCGTLINCRTLSVMRLRKKLSNKDLSQALIVEYSRNPGQAFQKRVLRLFRIQSQAMFYDCTHNSTRIAHANLRSAMVDIARRTWAYIRSLPQGKKPRSQVMIQTVAKLAEIAYFLLNARSKASKFPGYKCDITRPQVHLTVYEAFDTVFAPKRARYTDFIDWMHTEARAAAALASGFAKE